MAAHACMAVMSACQNCIFLAACCLLAATAIVASQSSENRNFSSSRDLYLLVLAPFPIPTNKFKVYSAGYSLLAGVDVALEIINERSDILPGYRLTYVVGNSACTSSTRAVVALAENIFHGDHNVAGIVGPACSGAASAVAPLITRDDEVNLLQVTIATSPQLTVTEYRNTYLAISSALVYVDIFIELLEKYQWSRIGVFAEINRFYFLSTFRSFQEGVPSNKIAFTSGIDVSFLPVIRARDELVRVLFVFAGGVLSSRLMCMAFHKGVIYPHHQWIFHDKNINYFLQEISFIIDGKRFHCTRKQMQRAFEGAIFARYDLQQSDTTKFIGDITYAEYLICYDQKLREGNEFDEYANAYYDAVWAMALSLNNSLVWFKEHNTSLSDYNYKNADATEEIRGQLLGLNFNGITGLINFTKYRESQTRVDLFQIVLNDETESNNTHMEKKVGVHITSLELLGGEEFIKSDFDKVVDISPWDRVLSIIVLVLLVLIVVANMLLVAVSIVFSSHSYIKASSPHLNLLIFSGCCCILVGVMMSVSGPAFLTSYTGFSAWVHSLLCVMPWWCFNMGYSLIYGTLCGKVWRVYRIFMLSTIKHRFIADYPIIIFVLGLLAFDVVVNISFNTVNPCYLQVVEEYFDGSDQVRFTVGCTNQYPVLQYIYVAIVVASKGLLLFILFFLAMLTRHVNNPMFRNTTEIAIITFCILFINGIGLPLTLLLSIDRLWSLVLLLITFSSPVVLCQFFIFLPPLLPLFREKWRYISKHLFHS